MTVKVELPNLPGEDVHVIDLGHPGKGLRDFIRDNLQSEVLGVSGINFNPLDTLLSQGEQN
ncbi:MULTISPECIES: hypothetical protein [Klebsiella]|uniref:hypothetical protein n=1 Tax=Klebsiella TaxID=570 RepID=UPI000B966BBB|nr:MULTISPECIES: hypothetical protein [Klebsiella]HCC6479076.1 hypothetical protein [Klebsiella oxytoca]MBA7863583.1 hypothetical protein [Klebsiella michiganensis]MDR4266870.1 hypothetical protein [Klebsiella grimontii]OYN76303.1 hypothetical protein CG021_25745 [Klebsiella pneumoniae]RIU74856.1 hypothetical protein D1621_26010 [Klebsiella pneumoniae]